MKDERIRYRAAERRALVDTGVHVFCLSSGNLRGPQMAQLFLRHEIAISAITQGSGPTFHTITRSGIRAIALDDGDQ